VINQYAIVGTIIERPVTLPTGGYVKIRIEICNEKANRTDQLEIILKASEWDSTAGIGTVVACTGSISGKINEKGYCNLSLYGRDVKIVTTPTGAQAPETIENDDDFAF